MYKRALKGCEAIFGPRHERTNKVFKAFLDLDILHYKTLQARLDFQGIGVDPKEKPLGSMIILTINGIHS